MILLVALVVSNETQAAGFSKQKLAVLEFEQSGNLPKDIGKMVAEWLTTSLVETGRFDTIERSLLTKLIEEQKMSSSGLVDHSSAAQLGKMYGVKTVVTGTVMSFDNKIEINARIISVETGSILATEKVIGGSVSDLRSKVDEIADMINQAFPLYGYIVRRQGKTVTIDLGRIHGVKVGMKMLVYIKGEPIRSKTGEVIDEEIIEKGQIVIKEVKEKASIGEVTNEKEYNCVNELCQIRGLKKDEDERLETENRIQEQEEQKRRAEALKQAEIDRRLAEEARKKKEEELRARAAEEELHRKEAAIRAAEEESARKAAEEAQRQKELEETKKAALEEARRKRDAELLKRKKTEEELRKAREEKERKELDDAITERRRALAKEREEREAKERQDAERAAAAERADKDRAAAAQRAEKDRAAAAEKAEKERVAAAEKTARERRKSDDDWRERLRKAKERKAEDERKAAEEEKAKNKENNNMNVIVPSF
ncbi:hypothetical protein L4X63_02160 [Geomonas sp. Red32]|nr:hypothetical protein [Geomonas sp. Red32]